MPHPSRLIHYSISLCSPQLNTSLQQVSSWHTEMQPARRDTHCCEEPGVVCHSILYYRFCYKYWYYLRDKIQLFSLCKSFQKTISVYDPQKESSDAHTALFPFSLGQAGKLLVRLCPISLRSLFLLLASFHQAFLITFIELGFCHCSLNNAVQRWPSRVGRSLTSEANRWTWDLGFFIPPLQCILFFCNLYLELLVTLLPHA